MKSSSSLFFTHGYATPQSPQGVHEKQIIPGEGSVILKEVMTFLGRLNYGYSPFFYEEAYVVITTF